MALRRRPDAGLELNLRRASRSHVPAAAPGPGRGAAGVQPPLAGRHAAPARWPAWSRPLDAAARRSRCERAGAEPAAPALARAGAPPAAWRDRYHGFWGKEEVVPDAVLQRAVAAMARRRPRAAPRSTWACRRCTWPARASRRAALDQPRQRAPPAGACARGRRRAVAHRRAAAQLRAGRASRCPPTWRTGYYRLHARRRAGRRVLPRRGRAARAASWPPGLRRGERWWGCTIQLYALRSSRNWGIGDFGDLRRLCDAAAHQGASFIGLSPLHALFPHNPASASPYSPSSRKALNPIYLDVQALVDLSGCEEARAAGAVRRLPGPAAARCARPRWSTTPAWPPPRSEVLRMLWRALRAARAGQATARAARTSWPTCASASTTIGRHALFEALQEHLHARRRRRLGLAGLAARSTATRTAPAVAGLPRSSTPRTVHFRFWLQWLAEVQLESCQRYARTRGMGIGLYCDLAVGVNGGGAETWVEHDAVRAGHARRRAARPAGPDRAGLGPAAAGARSALQRGPLPALHRHAARQHAPQRRAAAGPRDGADAPVLDRPATAAPTSTTRWTTCWACWRWRASATQCMVIGEDLGNVAPRMREAMREGNLLSYRPLLFERDDDGSFRRAGAVAGQGAGGGQHARPADAARLLAGRGHRAVGAGCGCIPTRRAARAAGARPRAGPRPAAAGAAARGPAARRRDACSRPRCPTRRRPSSTPSMPTWRARRAGWSACSWKTCTGQLLQVNVPGTTEDRFPNWRRKLSVTVEALGSDARWASLRRRAARRAQRPAAAAAGAAGAAAAGHRRRALRHLPRAVPQGLHLRATSRSAGALPARRWA